MSHLALSKNRLSKAICLAGLIAIVLSLPVYAQVVPTGTISGRVRDTSGAVIANAHVTLTNVGTNVTQTATTGSQGGYRFSALLVGHYNATVAKAGFRPAQNGGFMAGSMGDTVEQPAFTGIINQENSARQIQFAIRVMF